VREAVAVAMNNRVNIRNLLVELDEQKFQLQMLLFHMEQERMAREAAPAIIPAGHINLTPGRNGHQPH
jgi:hypothetical protein